MLINNRSIRSMMHIISGSRKGKKKLVYSKGRFIFRSKKASATVWREDDDISLLKCMIDYEVLKQSNPYDDMSKFLDFAKPFLHFNVKRIPLTRRLWRLKTRYVNSQYDTSKPNDEKLLELSRLIKAWGCRESLDDDKCENVVGSDGWNVDIDNDDVRNVDTVAIDDDDVRNVDNAVDGEDVWNVDIDDDIRNVDNVAIDDNYVRNVDNVAIVDDVVVDNVAIDDDDVRNVVNVAIDDGDVRNVDNEVIDDDDEDVWKVDNVSIYDDDVRNVHNLAIDDVVDVRNVDDMAIDDDDVRNVDDVAIDDDDVRNVDNVAIDDEDVCNVAIDGDDVRNVDNVAIGNDDVLNVDNVVIDVDDVQNVDNVAINDDDDVWNVNHMAIDDDVRNMNNVALDDENVRNVDNVAIDDDDDVLNKIFKLVKKKRKLVRRNDQNVREVNVVLDYVDIGKCSEVDRIKEKGKVVGDDQNDGEGNVVLDFIDGGKCLEVVVGDGQTDKEDAVVVEGIDVGKHEQVVKDKDMGNVVTHDDHNIKDDTVVVDEFDADGSKIAQVVKDKNKGKYVISDGQNIEEDDVVVISGDTVVVEGKDVTSMYPELTNALELKTLPGMPKKCVMDVINSMGREKANELEEKWADFRLMEIQLEAKKLDLSNKQIKVILEASRR